MVLTGMMPEIDQIKRLRTPAVFLLESRLDANISAMAQTAADNGVKLRPHVKTHKAPAIAFKQIQAGATGITVATIDEAQTFLMAGVKSILLAYPQIHREALALIIQSAQCHQAELLLTVDGPENVAAAATLAAELQVQLQLFLKVDVGLGRCGVNPQTESALTLVEQIASTPQLRLVGLLAHAGHAYAARSLQEINQIAEDERRVMLDFRSRCEKTLAQASEFDPNDKQKNHPQAQVKTKLQVSVGSTPTLLAQENFEGLDEIRPGNYVFRDLTMTSLGVATLKSCALAVLTRVVSINDKHVIVDAGSKSLSSDQGAHGSGNLSGFGLAVPLEKHLAGDYQNSARVQRLSEEHGFLERTATIDWVVGMHLAIIPNHACVVANLAPVYHVLSSGPDHNLMRWPISARRSADWDFMTMRPEEGA